MSLELLEKLEIRVQNTLETIELLQMELDEERQRSVQFEQSKTQAETELQQWKHKVEELLSQLSTEELA